MTVECHSALGFMLARITQEVARGTVVGCLDHQIF
jgi:hypothetical protein